MIKKVLICFLTVVLLIGKSIAQDKIIGIWSTAKNLAKVQIYKTGNLFYGKIISVADEKYNSKIGLLILKDFEANGNVFTKGTILEPTHNHTIKGTLKLSNDGQNLSVKGLAFWGLFSNSETWKKNN